MDVELLYKGIKSWLKENSFLSGLKDNKTSYFIYTLKGRFKYNNIKYFIEMNFPEIFSEIKNDIIPADFSMEYIKNGSYLKLYNKDKEYNIKFNQLNDLMLFQIYNKLKELIYQYNENHKEYEEYNNNNRK